jgi:hypothetical protein
VSEEPYTPSQNEDPAVRISPGAIGEAGGTEFHQQANGANPDSAPQNAAAPETGSPAAPVEPNSPATADHKLYEPSPSFDLVKKKGIINVSFVEWRGRCPDFSTHGWGATYAGQSYECRGCRGRFMTRCVYLPT